MVVNIRPPVDERIIGKMSIRHSFVAIAIFSGMIWATFLIMFRAVGEKDLTRMQQVVVLTALGIWILFCLCMAFVPRRQKLTPENFIQHAAAKGLHLLKAEQAAADPYGGLPGVKSVCAYVPDSASGRRILSKLSYHAADGNRDEVEGLIFVFFFPSEKKARAARAMLSDTGERLQKPDGSMVRLGFSQDRMAVLYKNTILYYNSRDLSIRSVLSTWTGKNKKAVR